MDIPKIYRQSWALTKKYKVLWFFGAILITFAGGGASFNFPGGGGGGSGTGSTRTLPSELASSSAGQSAISLEGQRILSQFGQQISNWIGQIPLSTWAFLGLGILVAMLLGLVISYVARSWVLVSLIAGINEGLDGKELTVASVAKFGFKSFRNVLWLQVVPGTVLTLYVSCLFVLGGIIFAVSNTVGIILGAVLALPLVLVPILGVFAIQIFALRIAVLENKPGKESFILGWQMLKGHFMDAIVLGIVNAFLSAGVGCLTVSVLGLIAGLVVIIYFINHVIGVLFGTIVVGVGVIALSFAVFFWGAYTVFNYSTWNLLYKELRTKS
jgi:hypothetical protein